MDSATVAQDPIRTLLESYNELNTSHIAELLEVPSPLEFMRYVSTNRPFVVRGGARDFKAVQAWNVANLKEVMGGMKVNVAVTPKGNADSPTLDENGELLFIKPHEEDQDFEEFLNYVINQEKSGRSEGDEIRYAQTQNDNFRQEYLPLFSDVPLNIPFARIALQNSPEAINLWIGNSHSTTALHKDPYQNIYAQILGQKHFVLLSPLFYPCVDEKPLSPASYTRSSSSPSTLTIVKEDADLVPFATWDPDGLSTSPHQEKYAHLAQPTRVTLNEGDILYLPALWYHKVSQSCGDEGVCCAVNYWHDMEFGGSFYPLCNFVRSVVLEKKERKDYVSE